MGKSLRGFLCYMLMRLILVANCIVKSRTWTFETFNQDFREAGERYIGLRKRKKKEWIQTETWQMIAEEKEKRSALPGHRQSNINLKEDTKNFTERLIKVAENASGRQNLTRMFRITTVQNGSSAAAMCKYMSRRGTRSGEVDKITQRKKHFQTILNTPETHPLK
ncbi:hypothetical protein CHS0354_036745 [Potamilus streckersoni]|uniref:Uncharacterized protein n=1 Tax=Potamilus streckersoni TaxID=2493646 RepID=A0AAE0TCN1_9BIVA|nr:hypothetical protein CHS0354_036745 [Potamilus streckersoni]